VKYQYLYNPKKIPIASSLSSCVNRHKCTLIRSIAFSSICIWLYPFQFYRRSCIALADSRVIFRFYRLIRTDVSTRSVLPEGINGCYNCGSSSYPFHCWMLLHIFRMVPRFSCQDKSIPLTGHCRRISQWR